MNPGELTRIVETVAELEDAPASDLPPLHDAIDTEALGRLFAPTKRAERNEGRVVFPYNGYTVSYSADGHVEVAPSTDPGSD